MNKESKKKQSSNIAIGEISKLLQILPPNYRTSVGILILLLIVIFSVKPWFFNSLMSSFPDSPWIAYLLTFTITIVFVLPLFFLLRKRAYQHPKVATLSTAVKGADRLYVGMLQVLTKHLTDYFRPEEAPRFFASLLIPDRSSFKLIIRAASDEISPTIIGVHEQVYKYPEEFRGFDLRQYGIDEYEGVASASFILGKDIGISDVLNEQVISRYPYFKHHASDNFSSRKYKCLYVRPLISFKSKQKAAFERYVGVLCIDSTTELLLDDRPIEIIAEASRILGEMVSIFEKNNHDA